MTFLLNTNEYNVTFNSINWLDKEEKPENYMTDIKFKDEGSHIIEAAVEGWLPPSQKEVDSIGPLKTETFEGTGGY